MPLRPNDFQVLDALDCEKITTQRQLADYTGISLGQINYTLRHLLESGLVRIGNVKNTPNKVKYAYRLTPKGIQAKSKLAVNFVMDRLVEYKRLKSRLADRLTRLQGEGRQRRVVFVGALEVKDFVAAIIGEQRLRLEVVHHLPSVAELAGCDTSGYDLVLIFDANPGEVAQVARQSGIPLQCVVSLW